MDKSGSAQDAESGNPSENDAGELINASSTLPSPSPRYQLRSDPVDICRRIDALLAPFTTFGWCDWMIWKENPLTYLTSNEFIDDWMARSEVIRKKSQRQRQRGWETYYAFTRKDARELCKALYWLHIRLKETYRELKGLGRGVTVMGRGWEAKSERIWAALKKRMGVLATGMRRLWIWGFKGKFERGERRLLAKPLPLIQTWED